MNINEIKKELYKQNPNATLQYINKGYIYYNCIISSGKDGMYSTSLFFKVPFSDLGDASFFTNIEAKFLIRWLITENG